MTIPSTFETCILGYGVSWEFFPDLKRILDEGNESRYTGRGGSTLHLHHPSGPAVHNLTHSTTTPHRPHPQRRPRPRGKHPTQPPRPILHASLTPPNQLTTTIQGRKRRMTSGGGGRGWGKASKHISVSSQDVQVKGGGETKETAVIDTSKGCASTGWRRFVCAHFSVY